MFLRHPWLCCEHGVSTYSQVMTVLDDAERMRGHLVVVGESGLRLRPLPAVFA
ncbi:MAG: hypothetical protein IPH76_00605 [Xanthomonadales bacterium]|nr:hypothetical protein [Xanthomonadales bacterium]